MAVIRCNECDNLIDMDWVECFTDPRDDCEMICVDCHEKVAEEIFEERVNDTFGWFLESFSEADEADLKRLAGMVLDGKLLTDNHAEIGGLVVDIVEKYCEVKDD